MLTTFLQSTVRDPYILYETMLVNHPVFWDDANQMWATYSYQNCKDILSSKDVHIPALNPNNKDGLNDYAWRMTSQFARLRNGSEHALAREAVTLLFAKRNTIFIGEIIEQLLLKSNHQKGIDWVNLICKKLPVIVILKSFGFCDKDCDFIAANAEKLVKIMLASKTAAEVEGINEVSKEIYFIVEKHLLSDNALQSVIQTLAKKYQAGGFDKINNDQIISLYVSNLIGLAIIQGYDANRGLLSNSFLQILKKQNSFSGVVTDTEYLRSMVMETLRFDPPVHNTKRMAMDDIALGDAVIKKGELIFIVLAAANRDPRQFVNPNIFDNTRINNYEHLTFGLGHHACPANQFSVNLAIETLSYFFERFRKIELVEKNIQYEPLINVRIPKKTLISVS